MAEAVPKIRVTGGSRDGAAQPPSPVGPISKDDSNRNVAGRSMTFNNREARPLSTGKAYPSKFMPSFASSQTNAPPKSDGRRDSQAIDPLSQQILQRTNTPNTQSFKMRQSVASEEDPANPETGPSVASRRTSLEPTVARAENTGPGAKEKKNKVSLFSRLAPKKKTATTDINDDEPEAGDQRKEGMDADVFSQPIGYIPQFPSPPKYIKVRSHGKKEREFNRIFLAQELRGRSGVEIAQTGGRLVKNGMHTPGDTRKDGNAIWALEFSKDGKYLAAGGKDYIVRVWAVLSSKEDRHTHEMEEDAASKTGQDVRLNAPVFRRRPVQEYAGHTASVLDLSWSKNNFLLSSSMDKTVRLWHVSREECLCCFKHSDFVTSIQFHPRDDRFFLAGSLDSKLRLWSIPDKSVAYWNTLPDLITAVSFAPDGKTAIAGCLNGLCLFYETEGLKYQTQIHVRSAHGKNAKGSKVTGIQAINFPPDDPNGEVKLLVTSNDSRVRVYNLRDKALELKLKGNENSCSQIHANFSDDAKYIICGSEDRKAYIWSTGQPETERDKRPLENFEAHQAIVTSAIMAPTRTRQTLSASGDPLYDLCNPPPVTLISRAQSHSSSIPPTEDDHQPSATLPPTPAIADFTKASKPEESPAYLARSAHPNGNIIVTADFLGHIKVFRQDCAFRNRLRNNDSALSRKMLGRTNSVTTRNSGRSNRNSVQNTNSSDRILSWRQSINSTNGSLDSFRNIGNQRSVSPRKSLGQISLQSTTRHFSQPTSLSKTSPPGASPQPSLPDQNSNDSRSPNEDDRIQSRKTKESANNPLMLQGEQSYMFWKSSGWQSQAAASSHLDPRSYYNHVDRHLNDGASGTTSTVASSNASANGYNAHLGPPIAREVSAVSQLSSEEENDEDDQASGEGGEIVCKRCGEASFKIKGGQGKKQTMECGSCGEAI